MIIDDIWQKIARLFTRPGLKPKCSGSDLITRVVVSECREWDMETELLSKMRERCYLFLAISSQSRFTRRRLWRKAPTR